VAGSDIDQSTRAMLMVMPSSFENQVERLIGEKDVSRLRLPAGLGTGMPAEVLANLHRRQREILAELNHIENALGVLAEVWSERLLTWRCLAQAELDGYQVLSRFGETERTFVLAGWVPQHDLQRVQTCFREAFQDRLLVQELPMSAALEARAPVLLDNPTLVHPFESLVKMMAVPRYNRSDPTFLTAIFLPIFFGLMLGDIGYGAIILLACLALLRCWRSGFQRDLLRILAAGAGWAVMFGILFGELFGTLGEQAGLHPIWMARDRAEDVFGLLLMTVAIGAGHVTLGLLLGVWQAVKDRSRTHLLERSGMLLGLCGLFLLVAVLQNFLPQGFMTPALAAVVVGIILLSASLGWIGILMGPIEFIGLIGNVLSYLRIAAIGLASVYLAKVANEMAGMVGSVVVGLILAILIHALNLVLGVFSPAIHSLRLHYVEFYRKFYEGGGRPYEPFQRRARVKI
jgi:V/A-type H+-transporting ATPase subunit I